MKMNKQITLDVELVMKLQSLNINVSEFCNQELWTYLTKLEDKKKDIKKENRNIDKEIEDLKQEKSKQTKRDLLKLEMAEEGITEKNLKFLNAMSTSIGAAKDSKEGWERLTGQKLNWNELKKLKEKWCI